MIDAPGPWGTGPFTLVEGYSSIHTVMAVQRVRPDFVATNLITGEDRTPRVVLEANRDHNSGRDARLERVVFVNDRSSAEALEAVCDREGEMDIVTEVSPADAQRVKDSEHARLVTIDANRMLCGVFNTYESNDAPLRSRSMARLSASRIRTSWDVLLNPWFDLYSDNPIAFVHREFFGHDGGFRAGPPDPEFDRRLGELARTIDPERSRALAEETDRYVYDQAKALFLCAPNALYAVNRHVDFKAYRATFELADTEVSPEHWSRRDP